MRASGGKVCMLVALALAALFGSSAAVAGQAGAVVYRQRCQSCHAQTEGQVLAPNLAGVLGRRAGAANFGYSPALKGSGLTWTKANLDRYLAGPGQVVPGTKMPISVPDSKERALLIDYLSSLR